jgi:hypothetical protein
VLRLKRNEEKWANYFLHNCFKESLPDGSRQANNDHLSSEKDFFLFFQFLPFP